MARTRAGGRELSSYIVEALFRLMEEKHFADISIREIIQCSGVSRSTYYRSFSCKEDIVRRFFDRLFQECIGTRETNLPAACGVMFQCLYRRRDQLLLLYRDGLLRLLLESFRRCPGALEQGPELESYGAAYHMGGLYSVLRLWLSRGMQEPPEEITRLTMKILRRGYGTCRPGARRKRSSAP